MAGIWRIIGKHTCSCLQPSSPRQGVLICYYLSYFFYEEPISREIFLLRKKEIDWFMKVVVLQYSVMDMEVLYFQAYIDGVDFVFIDNPILSHIENNIYGENRVAPWMESKHKLEKDRQGRATNPDLDLADTEKIFR
ncbi:hypothetical protein S83_052193 [Arachis hypogaea]